MDPSLAGSLRKRTTTVDEASTELSQVTNGLHKTAETTELPTTELPATVVLEDSDDDSDFEEYRESLRSEQELLDAEWIDAGEE